jgi:transposase
MTLQEALALIEELRRQNETLREENARLRERIEELERAAARQAAPFRRRQKKKVPPEEKKRPGRKGGHHGVSRTRPERVDERFDVPLDACPTCGDEVSDRTWVQQFIEDLPPVRPHVTELWTCVAQCRKCGEVRSTHPRQVSTAQGAAGVHLGARALGLAATLKNQLGMTASKVCQVLEQFGGLSLSPGGLMKALQRCSRKVDTCYQELVQSVRTASAVFADETSWWVDGPGWWLWVFTTPETTIYHVDQSRGSQVVLEMLGNDYPGMLVSDCLASYDPPPYRKHKCIAHHLKALKEQSQLLADRGKTSMYLMEWEVLLKDIIQTWHDLAELSPEQFAAKAVELNRRINLLLERPPPEPEEVAFRNRLAKRRHHLLGCLGEPAAEPTNNRAERALRPAVIARKLSCGNRTERGREAWQILTSLAATCQQRSQDFVEYLAPRLLLSPQAG